MKLKKITIDNDEPNLTITLHLTVEKDDLPNFTRTLSSLTNTNIFPFKIPFKEEEP